MHDHGDLLIVHDRFPGLGQPSNFIRLSQGLLVFSSFHIP